MFSFCLGTPTEQNHIGLPCVLHGPVERKDAPALKPGRRNNVGLFRLFRYYSAVAQGTGSSAWVTSTSTTRPATDHRVGRALVQQTTTSNSRGDESMTCV